jgi:uncharacterized protein YbaA (DUF1428 family)
MCRRRPERGKGLSFPRGIKTKPGETVLFSYIVFKSRAHRDRVNAKVMNDALMRCVRAAMNIKRS